MIKAIGTILIAIFLLQACSNIPVSTMMKMSGFDEEDFIKLKPEDIRVKVTSNTQVNVLAANQLSYSYKGSEAYIDDCLSLELFKEEVRTVEHWFRDDSFEHIGWYQLDTDAVAKFKQLQQHPILLNKKREGTFELTIQTVYSDESPTKFELSIDLLLDPKEGYFTMFEDLEIDQSPTRSAIETCEAGNTVTASASDKIPAQQ